MKWKRSKKSSGSGQESGQNEPTSALQEFGLNGSDFSNPEDETGQDEELDDVDVTNQ